MSQFTVCQPRVAARCIRCVAPATASLLNQIEALRAEVGYLRLRCEEEQVCVRQCTSAEPAHATGYYLEHLAYRRSQRVPLNGQ
jgi:hypothetical protein